MDIISKAFTVNYNEKRNEILIKGELIYGRNNDLLQEPGYVQHYEVKDGNNELIIDDNVVLLNTVNGSYEFVLRNKVSLGYSGPVLKIKYSGEETGIKCYDLSRQEDLKGVLEYLKGTGLDAVYDGVYKELSVRGGLIRAQIYDNPEIRVRDGNTEIIVRNLEKMIELRVIRNKPGKGHSSEVRVFYLYPNVKVRYFKPFLEVKILNR